MTRKEIETLIKEGAQKAPKLTWIKNGYAHSPFISKFATIQNHEYNSCYYTVYTLVANPKIHYVAVLSYCSGHYILKCGDSYLEGNMTQETSKKLLNNALNKSLQKPESHFSKKIIDSFSLTPRSSACNFNQKNYKNVAPLCEHIAQFLKDLPDNVLDELFLQYQERKKTTSSSTVSNELLDKFNRYAFKKHILLEGDKGSGKTYHATSWSEGKNVSKVFIGGHEQFESIDFLGHYIQQKSGALVWKDGALSEAFRKAKSGQKTLLIIDEILRIPKRELNILISSLSPIKKHYVLRTGRAVDVQDDIAMEEVIHAPVENLWIIGTTNIGAGYAVEEMDEALMDRFKPIRKDTSEDELRFILTMSAKAKSFPYRHVEKLMNFYGKMKRLHDTEILSKIVNIRHLNEAIELAENETEIQEIIHDSILLWVQRDYHGYPDKEQIEAIDMVMKKVWTSYD